MVGNFPSIFALFIFVAVASTASPIVSEIRAQESQDLVKLFLEDEQQPIDILLDDFKMWALQTYTKEMGAPPENEEELFDYMVEMLTYLF